MLKSAVTGGAFLSLWRPFYSKSDPAYTPLTPIGSIKSLVNYLRLLIDHKKHGKCQKWTSKCAPFAYTYVKRRCRLIENVLRYRTRMQNSPSWTSKCAPFPYTYAN